LNRIFPVDLPCNEWVQFRAEGFTAPVCGVIYCAANPPTNGMPLGGIDTGCLDLEVNGTFGYCTIFNSHVPRRGPLNLPFLGVSLNERAVLLARDAKGKKLPIKNGRGKLEYPSEIYYWGHYPVADLEYLVEPVSIGLRAWASFIPGDVESSMIPGIVFEVRLRNTDGNVQEGTIAFSFPGPTREEAEEADTYPHRLVRDGFSGVSVTNGGDIGYVLGAIGEETRLGGELGVNGEAWASIAEKLPETDEDEPGASVAVDFSLQSREEKVVRFILCWYSPRWKGGGTPAAGGNTYTHMYATRYSNALEAAQLLTKRHQTLLRRVLAWQQAVYTENRLPVWLRESLVNILHLITEDGLWAAAKPPIGDWCREEDGLFGMNECPRSCPQIECIPCSFYGCLPLVYFFPRLALSTLRGYKAYQYSDGAPPWIFGGFTDGTPPCEMVMPTRGYQLALNGPCYVAMVDRYWLCSGDDEFLREFYPSVKKCTIYTMNLRPGPEGILSVAVETKPGLKPGYGNDWFENCEFHGMTAHIGGIHLAHLRIAERMARRMGDEEFAEQCRKWFAEGSRLMEEKMWAGKYYLNYYDPGTGRVSDLVFAYQLDGEWIARFHGLPGVFRRDRVKTVLDTIKRINVSLTRFGAVNFANPDGTPARDVGYGPYSMFPPEVLMLAMTYMYEGEVDFGLELARRHWHNIVCEKGRTWDQPNILRGDVDTGEFVYGHDYYQNMMLWALPAAMQGEDLSAPTRPGGLVDRMIKAARNPG